MTPRPPPSFDAAERAALDEIGRQLRADGWARHVTPAWLLATWDELSVTANGYELSIDDYTNDLLARDGIEWALSVCQPLFRAKLSSWVEAADRAFVAGTEEDAEGSLGRSWPVDETSGWWWKRRPKTGPLADSLVGRSRM
jgi:hypothetical protein